MNVVLNRTVVVDSDCRFDNLYGSHIQSQSEFYHVSWWYYTVVIDLIGQLRCNVIGRLSVKPWCYWLWRLVISNWCVLLDRNQCLLDIDVVINWQLPKQSIHWLVSLDRTADLGVDPSTWSIFFEVMRWQVTSFQMIAGSSLIFLYSYEICCV